MCSSLRKTISPAFRILMLPVVLCVVEALWCVLPTTPPTPCGTLVIFVQALFTLHQRRIVRATVGKGARCQVWQPEFNPQDLNGVRKRTFKLSSNLHICTVVYTQNKGKLQNKALWVGSCFPLYTDTIRLISMLVIRYEKQHIQSPLADALLLG